MTTDAEPIRLSGWALVLGASSGFGAATSLALARAGMDIFGVHLDRKSTQPNAERLVTDIRALGRQAHFFNINAADEEKRAEVSSEMERILRERNEMGRVPRHAAFPRLRHPQALCHRSHQRGREQSANGHDARCHGPQPRVLGAGAGGSRPHGPGRPHLRHDLGGRRAGCSLLRPGLRGQGRPRVEHQAARRRSSPGTASPPTRSGPASPPRPPAQKIPNYEEFSAKAAERNPHRRLTTVEDVARAIVVFSHPDTYWMTGNVIGVDGGEEIVG